MCCWINLYFTGSTLIPTLWTLHRDMIFFVVAASEFHCKSRCNATASRPVARASRPWNFQPSSTSLPGAWCSNGNSASSTIPMASASSAIAQHANRTEPTSARYLMFSSYKPQHLFYLTVKMVSFPKRLNLCVDFDNRIHRDACRLAIFCCY